MSSDPHATHLVKLVAYGAKDGLQLSLKFASKDDAHQSSPEFPVLKHGDSPAKENDGLGQSSCYLEASIKLPQDFQPGVLLIKKRADKADYHVYLAKAELVSLKDQSKIHYTVESNIDATQNWRFFYPEDAIIPAFGNNMPQGYINFRRDELEIVKGTAEEAESMREGADQIYDFDTYCDLGSTEDGPKSRPTLGGGPLKYPRRLRTGRQKINGKEVNLTGGDLPWLPLDERFNILKHEEFTDGQLTAGASSLRSLLGTALGYSFLHSLVPFIKKKADINRSDEKSPFFSSFGVVDAMFDGLTGSDKESSTIVKQAVPLRELSDEELLIELKNVKIDRGLQQALGLGRDADAANRAIQQRIDELKKKESAAKIPSPPKGHSHWNFWPFKRSDDHEANPEYQDVDGKSGFNWRKPIDIVANLYKGFLEEWPTPGVRFGRSLEWRSDEDFARAAVAGQNPLSIRIVTPEDLKIFAVRDEHVEGLLEGKNLDSAVKEKCLFVLDFFPGYCEYIDKIASLRQGGSQSKGAPKNNAQKPLDNVLYAGRCIFYKRQNGPLMPVSIELQTDGESEMRVHTPNDIPEIWFLAKTIIASLDSGIHQLVSHWLTTHACVEPFIISTKRNLSSLSPLYKLLWPHFRYTMRLNCNGRNSLISAGGIIERTFSIGPFAMELSAKVYEGWRFDQQSFPADLIARGMAEDAGNGEIKLFLEDFPYAQDGQLVWKAILNFATEYLSLFYDDGKTGQRVTDDVEVQNWWTSVQKEGHPDTTEGWPEITDIKSLAYIAATIMWTASAHHAAVNFGQYDNAAYMPYRPSKIRKKLPAPDSKEEGLLRNCFEEEFLETVSDPLSTVVVMATLQILSSHSSDEEYLDRDEHRYIKDKRGKEIHRKFVEELQEAEKKMAERNEASLAKNRRGRNYELMMPSNPQKHPDAATRPPSRGIPYSISI